MIKSNYTKALTAVMALLGFPACDREPADLYAPLSIDYEIKGKVTEGSDTGKPIPGIRVIWQGDANEELADTVYTDKQGEFNFPNIYTFKSRIIAEDIDGDANGGSFLRDTVDLELGINEPADKNGTWYEVNFYLKKDTSDTNGDKETE